MWTPTESRWIRRDGKCPRFIGLVQVHTYAHGMAVDGKQNRADLE